jgi:hypothetical protein
MTHWAFDYIGKPWEVASAGPGSYDCWGLVVEIHKRFHNRDLQIISVEENNLRELIQTIDSHPERAFWDVIHNPMEGDIALMRQSRHPIHVGIWLDVDGGGMLHSMQGAGVIFQNLQSLTLAGWKVENYYRYKGE